jgi:hypothetical protein
MTLVVAQKVFLPFLIKVTYLQMIQFTNFAIINSQFFKNRTIIVEISRIYRPNI